MNINDLIDINVEEKLTEIVDEYFGADRDMQFKKEEIVMFVSRYLEDIKELAESVGV